MAKLNNVKVTAQTIEVSGIKYAQSDAKAVAGDIIRFDGGSSYVTEGAYYEVIRLDGCGDPQIVDNDGDEHDLCGDEFTVFKAAATPTTSDDIITHEGAQYRKVARKAEIGELVVVIANTNGHGIKNGQVVKITQGPYSSYSDSMAPDRELTWMRPADYRVLEPLKTSQTLPMSLPDAYVIHDGKVYVKESRKAAVGEKVVVTKTKTDYSRHFAAGDVGTRVSGEGWVNADIQVRFASGTTKFIGPSASNSEYAVLVPTDSVTIGDAEYTLERRKPSVGENVLVVKDNSPWYTVRRVVTLDAKAVVRPSGHINYADGNLGLSEGKYFVLTPKAAATQYREVNRLAAVGERIKIVDMRDHDVYGMYKNGDEFVAKESVYGEDVYVDEVKCVGNSSGLILRREYVVLEPIPTAKVPQAPYEPKSGDKVRAKSSKNVMTLTTRRPEFDGFLGLGKAWGYDGATHDWIGEAQFDVIERAEDVKVTPERLKVDEYARVLVSGKDVPKGGIVRIEADDRDGVPFNGREIGGDEDYDYFRPDQLERVSQADVDAAKPSPTFKVGDYVKLTIADGKYPSGGYGSVKNGDTGVIKRITGNDVVVDFPAQSGWYGLLTEFAPATTEDAKAAEDAAKQRELTAKWAAIGRKVGEIKNGDVVRIKRSFSAAGVKEGDIETVKSLDNDGVRLIKLNPQGLNAWVGCNFVELVAPVETLFNA